MSNKERNTNKPGKFAKKRKKRFPVFLVILMLLALAVCGWWMIQNLDLPAGETLPTETETNETAAPIESTAPMTTLPYGDDSLPQAYVHVLNRYAQAAAEKWDFIQCEDNQICYMIMFHEGLSKLGYHTPDLDRDGVRELIISDGNVIYDLYTLKGDELVWLLSGGERNSYQLCLDGYIFNHGSSSAAGFVDNIYYLKDGELILKEGIEFDGMKEPASWMLSGEGMEAPEPVNSNRYQKLLDDYQRVTIPLSPFHDTP